MGQVRHADRILAQKKEGKKQLWYLRLRTEGNIKMAFQEGRCENLDSVLLAQEGVGG
jgi:hypothetical protein